MTYACPEHGEVETETVQGEGVFGRRTITQEVCSVCGLECDPV